MNTPIVAMRSILILVGILVFLGAQAEAVVTMESFEPPVEVVSEGGQTWEVQTVPVHLDEGNRIVTGKNGMAELVFEDGSRLLLEEDTDLAIQELQFSEAKEVRVSRLKLLLGRLTAKATPLNFKKNVFEVETETVVAGFKFSSMTISFANGGTQIIPLDGNLEFRQIGGTTQIAYAGPDGETINYLLPPNADVAMDITPDEPVQITSNVAIANMAISRTDDNGDRTDIQLTLPANAQLEVAAYQNLSAGLSLTSTVPIPKVQIQATPSGGTLERATMRLPATEQVNVGINNQGRLQTSGDATPLPLEGAQGSGQGELVEPPAPENPPGRPVGSPTQP